MVALIEKLLGKGFDITIYDRDVRQARLIGANREYIEAEIPHFWELMRATVDEVLAHAETIVVGNGFGEFPRSSRGCAQIIEWWIWCASSATGARTAVGTEGSAGSPPPRRISNEHRRALERGAPAIQVMMIARICSRLRERCDSPNEKVPQFVESS